MNNNQVNVCMKKILHPFLWFGVFAVLTVPADAQEFRVIQEYSVSTLQIIHSDRFYPQGNLDVLTGLRAEVHRAVRHHTAAAAVAPLKQIVALAPYDYYAWEFLSYTYAVLGDVGSAANVDLDIVAQFEFIPAARLQVSGAMARLNTFDPNGWQDRVQSLRALNAVNSH